MSETIAIDRDTIAQYQRDGAVLLKGVISQEDVALLEAGFEEVYADPGQRSSKLHSADGKGETFLSTFPMMRSPSLQKLVAKGQIPELAGRMMEAPSAQLVLDQLFYKHKGFVNPTPWHQDTPFLRVRGDDMIRVWLTCDPSPKALTVQMVRGSHRWGVVFSGNAPKSNFKQSDEGKLFAYDDGESGAWAAPSPPDVARYKESFDVLSWDVEPGDALIFNGNMLHGADGMDDAPNPRRAFTTMWGGPELRYVDPGGNAIPTMAEVNKVQIPSGSRIGDFPDGFPIGWQEAG